MSFRASQVNHDYDHLLHGSAEAGAKPETEDGDDDFVEITPGEWKKQDHYNLLGLGTLRWRATEDDIKKACSLDILPVRAATNNDP